ncbi:MAG: hypothetical protein ACE5H7_06690 [Acidiferrobacterales bacterium]
MFDAMMPVLGGVFNAIGQGLANSLFGNPQEEARRKRQRELEAQRAAAAAQRRAEEEARRKEQEHKELMSAMMPVPGLARAPAPSFLPTGVNRPGNTDITYSTAHRKGYEDSTQCYPSNAFGYCAAAKPDETDSCIKGYQEGFAEGERPHSDMMTTAYQLGESAGKDGRKNDAFNDPHAIGPCRNEWIRTYNRGYFQGKTAQATK